MDVPMAERATYYFDGHPIETWTSTAPDFFFRPDELHRYMERGRWDLVFNALCYLTGIVEEGSA